MLAAMVSKDSGLNGKNVGDAADAIADLRNKLAGGQVSDVGITPYPGSSVAGAASPGMSRALQTADVDPSSGLIFSRTPSQVLGIVYGTGNPSAPGLFFPQGISTKS